MARAMWKASLRLGEVELPVKLYAAVEDRGVHFRLLHARDGVPVRQQMVDPQSGEEVPGDQVRRGLEIEPGRFVILSETELAEIEPEPSRTIELVRFVPRGTIDLSWYNRPYYLGPDRSEPEYFALARALEESGRRGVARWVMRGKRYFGALEERDGYLAIIALHSALEVVSADELKRPGGPTPSESERKLAQQLVAALEGPFDPGLLKDEYRERVRALIEAKTEGKTYRVKEPPAPGPADDLSAALRKSLRAAKAA